MSPADRATGHDADRIAQDLDDFTAFVTDPSNVHVVSSEYEPGGSDYSESCLNFDYSAARANCYLVRFTVNFID